MFLNHREELELKKALRFESEDVFTSIKLCFQIKHFNGFNLAVSLK